MSEMKELLYKKIVEGGLTAPRATPQDIENEIYPELAQYYVFPGTTVTVCCLPTRNGYNIIGTSAAVSLDNFDEEIGRKVALDAASSWVYDVQKKLQISGEKNEET